MEQVSDQAVADARKLKTELDIKTEIDMKTEMASVGETEAMRLLKTELDVERGLTAALGAKLAFVTAALSL
jgi:D-serine deaminase-like pyridoxal phosphate-dependent protein